MRAVELLGRSARTPHQMRDDGATLAALGVAAYLIADVMHEAVGHGTACLLHGARITLLTSVYFRCSVRMPFIAAAGPTANLVAAGLAWLVQRRLPIADARLRLLTLLTFAFNMFWGAGSMVLHSITNQDDWAIAVVNLEPFWLWRIGLVVLGSGLYIVGMRRVMRSVCVFAADTLSASHRARRLVLVPYAAAGAGACVAAAFYVPDPLRAVREAALETYAASFGLLLLPVLWSVKSSDTSMPLLPIRRSRTWMGAVAVALLVFTALLGRGMR